LLRGKKRKQFPIRTSFAIPRDNASGSGNDGNDIGAPITKKKRKMKAPIGIPKTFLQEVKTVTDESNTFEENGKFYVIKKPM